MKFARPIAVILGIATIVAVYGANRYGGFNKDAVYQTALREANGDPVAALSRLGPAYFDRNGSLIYLTLNRSIARTGKAAALPAYQLGNDCLAKVKRVETIQHLTVGHPTWINDSGMKHIAEMQNLQTLSLKFTPLSKLGLSYLEPLQNLKVLYVSSAQLTPVDARRFERSVAGCEVVLWPEEAGQASEVRTRLQDEFIEKVKTGSLQRFPGSH